jgi:long-chain acyl-CoA synthetase
MMMLHACSSQSVTISTVYANLGEDGLQHALNEGKVTHLFMSSDLFQAVANVIDKCPSLKVIIYKDKPQQKIMDSIKAKDVRFFSFEEIEEIGKQNPVPPTPPKPTDVMMHMYTSGTTGAPKVSVFQI